MTQRKVKTIMTLSWELQRKKKLTRSKALMTAWSITQHADITIYYLVKKHSHKHYENKVTPTSLTLFK
jgi:hypothetical protein